MTPKLLYRTCKILVVDDHDICNRHTLAALETPASEVRAVYTANEAIRQALSWLPDAICIDLHLQDRSGVEVIRKIRLHWPAGRQQPRIIVLSGDQKAINAQDMARLDVDCSLVKPVSGRQLRHLIGATGSSDHQRPNNEKLETHLYELFLEELHERIPLLDQCFAALELEEITGILHQLMASAAIVHEYRFESELRSLNASCRSGSSIQELASRYHAVLESARKLLSQG